MQPSGMAGGAGHFGLRKNMNLPPVLQKTQEKTNKNMADEISEGLEIPKIEEPQDIVIPKAEQVDQKIETSTNSDNTNLDEAFICSECQAEFETKNKLRLHRMGKHKIYH